MFGRNKAKPDYQEDHYEPTKSEIKRATRARLLWALLTSLLLLITVIFLILVEVGDTSVSSIRNKIYFINLDLSDIIPTGVPNAALINSIARTLGLHDFYTVGLWGFCEGYNGQGVTDCSSPKLMYWFNPVEIIQSELISGATIALPASITNVLHIVHIASNWMFALFLTGVCLSFVMIFIVPLSVYSRWATLPITILTFLAALFTTAASVVATVMFILVKQKVTQVQELNIGATIGVEMFVFMWIASATAILAWLIQLGMCCCCASRRDVKTGRKRGSKHAWSSDMSSMGEKHIDEDRGRTRERDSSEETL